MKYISSLILLILFSNLSYSQIVNPVHWSWKATLVSGDEYKIVFTAVIDKPWHTYGMYIQEGGPVKTSFTYEKNAAVALLGKMTETGTNVKEGVDDVFQVRVKVFQGTATFEQHVKGKKGAIVKGSLEFMACDDKSCLPPDTKKFEVTLP